MSSSSSSLLVLLAITCLISPSISQTCKTQNLKTPLQTCLDLPVLNSSLHYTYNAANSSLTVAFIATPLQPNGWVAWAINPNGTRMPGSQAFVAHRSDGSVAKVKTLNIVDYHTLLPGKLSFDFWDLRAESMGDQIAIHVTVKVPKDAENVNQVWQTGAAWNTTRDGPGIHPIAPGTPNLKSMAELSLSGKASTPTNGGGGGGSSSSPGKSGSMSTSVSFGVNLGLLVLLGSSFIF